LAGYKIYRSTDDQNYELIQQVGLVTSWSDTGLVNGTTYYYRITAYDTENNESEMSDKVSAVPSRPSPPVTTVIHKNLYTNGTVSIHNNVGVVKGNVQAVGNVTLQNNALVF